MKLQIGLAICATLVALACGSSSDPARPTTELQTSDNPNSLTLSESAKDLAIGVITGYDEVLDAAISQDGRDLSLVVIVGCATSEEVAKNLGDNFVRLVKTFGPELAPTGTEIGKGDFDYLVGVYCGNERKLAQGAKVRNAGNITW